MDDHDHRIDEYVRRAEPADRRLSTQLTDPATKAALLRRILLDAGPAAATPPRFDVHRRRVFTAAAVAAMVVAGTTLLAQGWRAVGDPPEARPPAAGTTTADAEPSTAPPTPGLTAQPDLGGVMASCAVRGTPEEVATYSDVAFDGTVVAVAASPVRWMGMSTAEVTFAVGRWFRGPGGQRFTVRMLSPEHREDGLLYWGYLPYGVGTRMLVAGDDTGTEFTAGGCGMTTHYRAGRATDWARAFVATPSPSRR